MNALRSFTGLCLAVLALLGCHTTVSTGPEPGAPFTAQDATLFDDSVDFAENVQGIGGRVASQWRTQIDRLSREADLVVQVRVETVNSGHESTGTSLYRLDAVVTGNGIKGEVPADRRVELRVSEGEPGFNQIHGNESRLQASVYVLWARWYRDTDRTVRAHWHLSPSNDALLRRIHEAIGFIDPNAPRETVVRTN